MNKLELINILLIILSIYLIYKSNVINSLLVFAGYFILHYFYLYIPVILSSYSIDEIYQMRILGSGIVSKVLQLIMIGVLLVKIEFQLGWNKKSSKYFILINIFMLSGLIYQHINLGSLDRLAIQYYLTLCLFVWIVFIPSRINSGVNFNLINKEIIKNSIIFFLLIVICLGIYEVWIDKAWAQTQVDANHYVYRSSSLFYNPNLFSYYCVLAYLAVIYFSDNKRNIDNKTTLIAFALLFGIFISGSRGVFLYFLVSMAIIAILNKKIKLLYFYPYGLYLITLLASIVVDNNFPLKINRNNISENFYYLSNRFAYTPIDIFTYLLNTLQNNEGVSNVTGYFSTNILNNLSTNSPTTMSTNSQLSIEGRFCSGCDNGWMILYRDLGLFGLVSFLILYLYIFFNIIKLKDINKNLKHILLSAILFILIFGSAMRFQILTVAMVTATYICLLLIINRIK
ncbi:O-antigen polymerase [Polynucleobacter sp. AM-7D1]|uniref:O-antigen polymerase n=1 Tax=Polynucleobacter sp. AM-7D1 TaxID=2689102 RepID=UPI001BFE4A2E|nr:O-antigen polymerase [Polynucleobacter sp. AM-7D1]QWE29007.1 oligosaccharide repeat unit polymerase [Polynucleobacter sp. AM-7D1]